MTDAAGIDEPIRSYDHGAPRSNLEPPYAAGDRLFQLGGNQSYGNVLAVAKFPLKMAQL
jgi:hypothetical protein